jgi:hypothetical protein
MDVILYRFLQQPDDFKNDDFTPAREGKADPDAFVVFAVFVDRGFRETVLLKRHSSTFLAISARSYPSQNASFSGHQLVRRIQGSFFSRMSMELVTCARLSGAMSGSFDSVAQARSDDSGQALFFYDSAAPRNGFLGHPNFAAVSAWYEETVRGFPCPAVDDAVSDGKRNE